MNLLCAYKGHWLTVSILQGQGTSSECLTGLRALPVSTVILSPEAQQPSLLELLTQPSEVRCPCSPPQLS